MWKAKSKKACIPTPLISNVKSYSKTGFLRCPFPRKGPLSASRWFKTFLRKPRLNDQTFSSNIVLEEHAWSFSRFSHFVLIWFSMGVWRRMNVEQTFLSDNSFNRLPTQSTKRTHLAKSNQMNKEKYFRGLTLSGVWPNNVCPFTHPTLCLPHQIIIIQYYALKFNTAVVKFAHKCTHAKTADNVQFREQMNINFLSQQVRILQQNY